MLVVRALGRGIARGWPLLAAATLIAGSIVGGYYGIEWVSTSPRFAVANIKISGVRHADLEPVLKSLRGRNVFDFELARVESQVEALPWIQAASVERTLPDGLKVEVTEHVAVAAVDLGGLYLVTKNGEPFKRATASEAAGVPLITGLDRDGFLASPEIVRSQIRTAMSVVESSDEESRPAISEVHFDRNHGYSIVTLDEGITVHLGGVAADFRARLSAFDVIWSALPDHRRPLLRTVFPSGASNTRTTLAFAKLSSTDHHGQN